jgi:hypothetical protein
MSSKKISQLPLYSGDPTGTYLVMNNAWETGSFKVLRETVVGSSGSSGTSGISGSSGTSGTSFSSPYSGNLNGTAGQSWMSSYGATAGINWNNGNVQTHTLTASTTFTFDNPNNGATYILAVKQAAAGNYVINWPSITWVGGAVPVMTATANKTDIYTFVYISNIYYGSYSQNF